MSIASTINDVIRVSEAYAEDGPTEVSMEDLKAVMGGSLEGLGKAIVNQIPGAKPVLEIAQEIPGAIEEVSTWYQETFPSDAQVAESQATNQAAGEAARLASDHASYAAAMNNQAGDVRTVTNGYY